MKFNFKIKLFVLFFIAMLHRELLLSQSFNTGILFNPGLTLSSDYMLPSSVSDTSDFELTKYNIKFTQPLKTKIGIDLKNFNFKKMDAKASQIFLHYNFGVAQPRVSDNNNYENIYRVGIGITALAASIRKGIWLYSANVFADENHETFTKSFTPNFRTYVANIKTKNLKTFYFYGAGLLVNQVKIIPFPLLGLKTRLGKSDFRAELIVPLHAKLNYRFNKKVNMDAVVHFNGINTIYRQGSGYSDNDITFNLRQLKTYLALNTKLGSHYKLKVEGGYSVLQRITSWEGSLSQDVDPAPYLGLTFSYNFGKSVFGNFMSQGD
ncbi:MAG: DUF6268 family outer membrane beta-barrel protein [Vicingaceae bacterium]|nr:DUF6268 family outer membrane beta-barrel protein [Vicingaceae bacterium]